MMRLGRMLFASSHVFGVTLLKAESRSSSGAFLGAAISALRFSALRPQDFSLACRL